MISRSWLHSDAGIGAVVEPSGAAIGTATKARTKSSRAEAACHQAEPTTTTMRPAAAAREG